MIVIPISPIPNQSFSIVLNNINFFIRITYCYNIMSFDIYASNVAIINGQRATPGFFIIPYQYLEQGNFIFITNNNEYPDYTRFGISQSLIYLTQSDLETIRSGL